MSDKLQNQVAQITGAARTLWVWSPGFSRQRTQKRNDSEINPTLGETETWPAKAGTPYIR
jgi:hypothetical protein